VSLFPNGIWKPTPKDLQADLNPQQALLLNGVALAATVVAATIGLSPQVPADKVLLVANVFGVAVAGAAQTVNRLRLRVGFVDGAGVFTSQSDFDSTGVVAPVVELARSWQPGQPGFPLMQGQVIEARGDFSAGGAVNVISISVIGVFIPRGNWQRS
jgi:hypothetical protein